MNETTALLIPIIIVFVVIGYGYYFLVGRKRMNRQLGIEEGDAMHRVYNAEVVTNVSPTKKAALLALGLLVGTVATFRGRNLRVSITRNGNVALGYIEDGGGEVIRYTPANKPRITLVGDGNTTMAGWNKPLERTKIVEIAPGQGESFQLIMPESGANDLVAWAAN